MKRTKKFALLSLLAGFCLLAGGAGIGATQAYAQQPSIGDSSNADAGKDDINWADNPDFWMQAGASIRVPNAQEDEDSDKDGLKFRAYISDSFVEERKAEVGDDIEVGMFIMPAYYYNAVPATYETCFGDDALYYWEGNVPANTTDKKQIVHVQSFAYHLNETDGYLIFEGSIWNLRTENLDLGFVAVGYMRAGDDYYFANSTSKNEGTTAVNVAQRALLNTNDGIHHIEGDEEAPSRVDKQYVQRYLGESGKQVSYVENVYKEQGDGSYLKTSTTEKTALATAYNTPVTFPTADEGYHLDTTRSNADACLMLDNSLVVNAYYSVSRYNVVFNTNGGTIVSGSNLQSVAYGESAVAPTVSRAGYTFLGWDKTFSSIKGHTTVNAQWTANTYTVTFNGNGATNGSMSNLSVTYGKSLTLTSNAYEKEGAVFLGWATSASGGAEYVDGATFTYQYPNNVTLYAVWKANDSATYKVQYYLENLADDNYALKSEETLSAPYGQTVSAQIKEYDYYTYKPGGSVTSGMVKQDGSLVLKVYYMRVRHTVTFDLNGGTLVSGSLTQTVKHGMDAKAPVVAREGLNFLGWDGAFDNVAQDITVSALWSSTKTTLKFNANGGTGTMNDIYLTTDQTVNLPANTFQKEGSRFLGWATSADGEVVYANGAEYTMHATTTQTLYAVWETIIIAPVFDAPQSVVVWLDNGTATLPTINIVSSWEYTLTLTLKNSAGTVVTVTDGKFSAVAGTYTATYVATNQIDTSKTTTFTQKIIVKQSGMINDFSSSAEAQHWNSDCVRVASSALQVYYTLGDSVTLLNSKNLPLTDWSDFTTFEMKVVNGRGLPLTVTAFFLVDGEWQETAGTTFAGDATGTLQVYLADYGVTGAQAIRLQLDCDDGIICSIDNVRLTTDADTRTLPTNSEISGFGGGMYPLNANAGKTIALNNPANSLGIVKYKIYANVAFTARVGLHYANGSVYANKRLQAGWNEFVRYPDAEYGSALVSSTLKSISIENFENYDVVAYLSGVTFEQLTSVDMSSYAVTSASYSVAYGESFAIPSPFTSNLNWYSGLAVTLKQNSTVKKSGLSIGSVLVTTGTGALSAGAYQIVYAFTDITGASKSISYTLVVEQNELSVSVKIPVLFADKTSGYLLPTPTITSAKYGNTTVQVGATVKKYYRVQGASNWTLLASGEYFKPKADTVYQIRYVVEYSGVHREVQVDKYVGACSTGISFEREENVGLDAYWGTNASGAYVKEASRFYYDGGAYNYNTLPKEHQFAVVNDWSKSGNASVMIDNGGTTGTATLLVRPGIQNLNGFNAVRVWIKSEKYIEKYKLQVGQGVNANAPFISGTWVNTEEFTLKRGEHLYTLFLEKEVPAGTLIGGISFLAKPNNKFYVDDFTLLNLNRLDMEDFNGYDGQMDNSAGYTLFAPVVTSDYYTTDELAKAKVTLQYSLNAGTYQEIAPDASGDYCLKLNGAFGRVNFKWTVTVAGVNVDKDDTVITKEITGVYIGAPELQVDYDEVVTQNTSVTLATPTCAEGVVEDAWAEYKPLNSETWTALDAVSGGFALPTDTVGWFNVRYNVTVSKDGESTSAVMYIEVYVRGQYTFIDFEGTDKFRGGEDYFDATTGGKGPETQAELVVWDDVNNNTALRILCNHNGWEGVHFASPVALGNTYNVVSFKMYTPKSVSGYKWEIHGYKDSTSNGWFEHTVDLKAGWNEVSGYVPEFNKFRSLILKINNNGSLPAGMMLDDIQFMKVSFSGTAKPGTVNQALTLPTGTCGSINAVVSYRLAGTSAWTTISSGSTFTPTSVGTYEIRYAFNGIVDLFDEVVVGYSVSYLDSYFTSSSVKYGTRIQIPTVVQNGEIATVSYRASGESSWTAVTDNAFDAVNEAGYDVRFYFASAGSEVIKHVYVAPATERLLTDFETPFDADDAYYTTYNHVNTYTDTIRAEGDGRATYYQLVTESGNTSMKILQANGWEGPYWRNGGIQIGFATGTFTFKGKNIKEGLPVYICYVDENGARKEFEMTIDYANRTSLGNDWYQYTMTINGGYKTSSVRCFEFRTNPDYFNYFLDDMYAIREL